MWENDKTLTLEQTLIGVKEEEFRHSLTARTLCGIGWEFIWGRTPPEFVEQERKSLLNKIQRGEKLSELEEFWHVLISIDTDIF